MDKDKVNPEILKNLDMYLNMDVLEVEKDWENISDLNDIETLEEDDES